MTAKHRQFLEKLLITPSPVGFESAGQKVWIDHLEPMADEMIVDAYGSAAARLEVKGATKTILLEAHCDEIGMVVQHIDDSGFVAINRLGGSDPTIARAKRVSIHTRQGVVSGVVGNTAIHLQDRDSNKQPSWKDLFVDIGVSSREEALTLVQIGDPITYAGDFEYLSDELVTGRAIDNRIGGFIIAQAFERLRKARAKLKVNVIALNSVQEEVGGFGARMMSYRLRPDAAIVTDVTHATDTPGINHREHGLVKLGKGAVIQHGGAAHPAIVRMLEDVAGARSIAVQHEATSVRTGTDTDSIFHSRSGIPSALISTPLRYMHSPAELVSLEDVECVAGLMTEFVLALKGDEAFKVV
jgi:putative aminopeptidase FrvX